MEKDLVMRENVDFMPIPAAGLHGVDLFHTPGNLWQLFKGTLRSRQILRSYKPDVMLFTGGYVAVPMAVAGRSIPSLLYVPDIEPGLALKFLSRFSTQMALTTASSRRYFSRNANIAVTGYPTRPGLTRIDKSTARRSLGLTGHKPVLFVFGGSKGARSINQALWANLSALLDIAEIIHVTGALDWPGVEDITNALEPEKRASYHPYSYLHEEMAAAFSAADLVVCRAGASTLGELPLYGLPSILIPYPHAWRYQKVNAEFLAGHGAAQIIRDEDLGKEILPTVQDLLSSPEKLSKMSGAASSLSTPQAASNLALLLEQLANKSSQVTPC